MKGAHFRILQNNSNSFLDIVLGTKLVPGYSIMFLMCKSVPNNFLGDEVLTILPTNKGGGSNIGWSYKMQVY